MESTTAAEPSSAMEETPNWLEMPHDLMRMILQRLGAVEILNSAQKVCTTWRRLCKDPAMWKVIDMRYSDDGWIKGYDFENLAKQAVQRSLGELIDISIEGFGINDLLCHVSRCSSKLNSLRLEKTRITSDGLSHAVKKLRHLEKLHIFFIRMYAEDVEVIGRSCPLLKSFKMNNVYTWRNVEINDCALAIAKNMPELRDLQLFGSKMTNYGLQAILHGCPHLKSLDLRRCSNLILDGSLGKLCMERIKDLKLPLDSTENCGFDYGFSYDAYFDDGNYDSDDYHAYDDGFYGYYD